MINTFDFKLVTPNKVIFDKKIIGVTLGTMAGQIGILAGHEALVGVVVPSRMTVFDNNGVKTE
jgi:F0F1-type ATP synthase epsilon subunit